MKNHAPATTRNREFILKILREELAPTARVLEIASGTGEHAAFFAPALDGVTWQPSDIGQSQLDSISAWRADASTPNILQPTRVDASAPAWHVGKFDAVVCINMIHISPWAACQGLFAGCGRHLDDQGLIYLYGPYFANDRPREPSNIAFDESLRGRNPEWGIRHLERVDDEARSNGFKRARTVAMPANNLSIVYRRIDPHGTD